MPDGTGMYGTSSSGFNALQLACERPPALRAIIATDDLPHAGSPAPATDPMVLGTRTHPSDGGSGGGASQGSSAEDEDDPSDVGWWVERDVLGRATACAVDHGSTYDVELARGRAVRRAGRGGHGHVRAAGHLVGGVTVTWPEATARARTDLRWSADPTTFHVDLTVETWRDGEPFAQRRWTRDIPRDLA